MAPGYTLWKSGICSASGQSCRLMDPRTSTTRPSWSKSDSPGNSGHIPVATDAISMAACRAMQVSVENGLVDWLAADHNTLQPVQGPRQGASRRSRPCRATGTGMRSTAVSGSVRTQHLGEDAADGPHVGGGPVAPAAQQQLGRAVPARGNRVRVRGRAPALRGVVRPRQAQVPHLQGPLRRQQQVRRLEVAVQIACEAPQCITGVAKDATLPVPYMNKCPLSQDLTAHRRVTFCRGMPV